MGTGPTAKSFVVAYAWGSSGAANGKLSSVTYPSGARVNYAYDSAGRVASLSLNPANANGIGTNLSTTVPLLGAAAYNGANALLGWNWGNGSAYQRSFDEHGRLKTYPLGNPAGSGAAAGTTRTMAYDNGLGVVGMAHSQAGTAQPALDQAFGYDPLDRLISASLAGTASSYGYDATGNRSSRVVNGMLYTNTVAPTSNRLATVQAAGTSGTVTHTHVHDAAGNVTQDGTATYAYSDRGRLRSATVAGGSVNYLVNALEQRVHKSGPTALVTTGAMYYVHDEQGHLLGQYDANLAAVHETVYLGDTPVAVLKSTGSAQAGTLQMVAHHVYADQIDTPRVITRATDEAIVWRWDQAEAFGATPPVDNPSGLGAFRFDQRFPGQVFDAETGNHDNWHRTYQAQIGRYVQSDPIGLQGGINTYAYALANPLALSDPTGENPGAAIGGALALAREAIKRCASNPACKCRAIYAAYKTMCGIGCGGTTCDVLTIQARAAGLCFSLRQLYITSGCDRHIPTTVNHPGAADQAKRAWENYEKKRDRVCCSGN